MVALGPIWMIPCDLLVIQQWYQSRGSTRIKRYTCKCMQMKELPLDGEHKQIDGLVFNGLTFDIYVVSVS